MTASPTGFPDQDPLGPFGPFAEGGAIEGPQRHLTAVPSDDDADDTVEPARHQHDRHREDPAGAYEAAVNALALCDPDVFRTSGVALGKTSQAIPVHEFYFMTSRVYDGLCRIRCGALENEAIALAEPLVKVAESTGAEIAKIKAEGIAADAICTLFRDDVEPRLRRQLEEVEALRTAVKAQLEAYDAAAIADEEWHERAQQENPTRVGGPFDWLPIYVFLKFVAPLEILLSGLLLSGPVEQVISIEIPYGGAFIGMAMSAMLYMIGLAGGFASAAIKAWVRLVAALFTAGAVYLSFRAVGPLDAIRMGETIEGVKFFTVATLGNMYLAGITGYGYAVNRMFDRRRKALESLPTRAELKVEQRLALVDDLDDLDARATELRTTLVATEDRIQELGEAVANAPVRALTRLVEGQKAIQGAQAVLAALKVRIGQEVANRDVAVTIAMMAYHKTVAEKVPDDEVPVEVVVARQAGPRRWAWVVTAVLATLVVLGAIAAVLGYVIGGVVAGVAALVLLVRALRGRIRNGEEQPEVFDTSYVRPPVDTSAQTYKFLARSTQPKHGRGGASTTERN